MVKTIIWVAIGLLALSFFGISIRGLVESPTNQDNVAFMLNLAHNGWQIITLWFSHLPSYFSTLGHVDFTKINATSGN